MLESFDNQKFDDIVDKCKKDQNILAKIEKILKDNNDLASFTPDRIGLQVSCGKCCDDPKKLFEKLASAKIAVQVMINNRKNKEYFQRCVLLTTHLSEPCHEDVNRKVDTDAYAILEYIILHKLLYDIEANASSNGGQTKKKRNKDIPIKCSYCDIENNGNNEECEICQAELDPYEVQLPAADSVRRVNEHIKSEVTNYQREVRVNEPIKSEVTNYQREVRVNEPIKSEVTNHQMEVRVNEPIKSEVTNYQREVRVNEPIKSEASMHKVEVTTNRLMKNEGMTTRSSSSRRDSGNVIEVAPPSRIPDRGDTWTCKRCTLSNKSSDVTCDACFYSKNEVERPLQDDHMQDENEFPPLALTRNEGTNKGRRQPLENNQSEKPYKSLPQESLFEIEGGSKGMSDERVGAGRGWRSRPGASGADRGRNDMSGRNDRGGIDARKVDKKIEGNKYEILSAVSDDAILDQAEVLVMGASKGDWNCPRCTYLNKAGINKCALCESVDEPGNHKAKRHKSSNSDNNSQSGWNKGRGRDSNKDNGGHFKSLGAVHTCGKLEVNATFYDDLCLDNASVEESIVNSINQYDSSKNKNNKGGGSKSPGGGCKSGKSEGKSQFYDGSKINDCASSKDDRNDRSDQCQSRGNKETKTVKENKETNNKGRSDKGNAVEGNKGGGISQSPSMEREGEQGSPPCRPRDCVPMVVDGWTCPSCTFNNKKGSLCCEACYTIRPREDAVKGDEGDDYEVVEADDIPQASWRCLHCKKDNSFDTYICQSCRKYAPFFQKWVCERCAFFNDKLARECAVCDKKNAYLKFCDKCKIGVVHLEDKVRQCADCVEREREAIQLIQRTGNSKGTSTANEAASGDGFTDYKPRSCPRCKRVLDVPTDGMCPKCMANKYYCNNRHCGAINDSRSKHCKKCKVKKGDNITDYNAVDVHNGRVYVKMWQCTFCGLFNAKGKCTKCKNRRHSATYKKCLCKWINLNIAVKCDKCFQILR